MIEELLNDKLIKPKEKTETLSAWLLDSKISVDELLSFATSAKDSPKATCIEALEFASQQNAAIVNEACFNFAVQLLKAKAPRVKWESAKVIGNTAHLYTNNLNTAINNLLLNTEHDGTVVRWSAAFALAEILKLKTKHNKTLLSDIEVICQREEKNSILKIYLTALKKVGK